LGFGNYAIAGLTCGAHRKGSAWLPAEKILHR
jgi:hypothetical protein